MMEVVVLVAVVRTDVVGCILDVSAILLVLVEQSVDVDEDLC